MSRPERERFNDRCIAHESLHHIIRSMRVSSWRKPSLISLVVGSIIVWVLWLQFTWQPVSIICKVGFITFGLVIENYFVNVKLRKLGAEELNPLYRRIEKHIPFKYAAPLLIGAASVAAFLSGVPLDMGLWQIPLIFALVLPVALICSINDALVLWDGPVMEEGQ